MAKLNKKLAKQAEEKKDDFDGFGVVDPGVYLCKLTDVNTEKSGPAGPYWTWEFTTVGVGGEPKDKKFWDNTSLSEKAIGRLGKVFEAFGTTTDADTDDLIGDLVAVEVKVGTIKQGDKTGEQRNEVVRLHRADQHALFADYEEEAAAGRETASGDDFD